MAIISEDIVALRRELTINKALDAAVTGVPLLAELRGASSEGDTQAGGYYGADDVYVGYWMAGDEVGSKPLKEF